jgi:hypothetical protein
MTKKSKNQAINVTPLGISLRSYLELMMDSKQLKDQQVQ